MTDHTRADLVDWLRTFADDVNAFRSDARAAANMLEADGEVVEALADMLRIESYRYSAGLGKKQIERYERAKAVLSAARERKGGPS